MDEFKLKSIDDFDSLFAAGIKAEAQKEPEIKEKPVAPFTPVTPVAPAAPVAAPADSLIPQMENQNKMFDAFEDVSSGNNTQPIYSSPSAQYAATADNSPLYSSDSMSSRPVNPFASEPDYADDDDKNEKKKISGGALAGKIISIIMLVVTIVVFLIGCFVTVFLDNNGKALAGYTFNTIDYDIKDLNVAKGDLVLGKLGEAEDYEPSSLVLVPVKDEEDNTIKTTIVAVSSSTINGDTATIIGTDQANRKSVTISSANTFGIVVPVAIPFLGSILGFALHSAINAILVVVLFVLLAALWFLVIILIDKSKSKKSKGQDNFDDNNNYPDQPISSVNPGYQDFNNNNQYPMQ